MLFTTSLIDVTLCSSSGNISYQFNFLGFGNKAIDEIKSCSNES